MTAKNNSAMEAEEQALIITRVFDAPRELVFKAWSEPERMKAGGGRKASRRPFARSISAWAARS
jgi:uncharacterized protein YndB with AHSA1/START domain